MLRNFCQSYFLWVFKADRSLISPDLCVRPSAILSSMHHSIFRYFAIHCLVLDKHSHSCITNFALIIKTMYRSHSLQINFQYLKELVFIFIHYTTFLICNIVHKVLKFIFYWNPDSPPVPHYVFSPFYLKVMDLAADNLCNLCIVSYYTKNINYNSFSFPA